MIMVFGILLGNTVAAARIPVRQVYKSIVSANTRIQIMENMLQQSHLNTKRGQEFDEIIGEFKSLNKLRNTFLHGIWTTHDTGKVYLAESSMDDFWLMKEAREVKILELQKVVERMRAFSKRAFDIYRDDIVKSTGDNPSKT